MTVGIGIGFLPIVGYAMRDEYAGMKTLLLCFVLLLTACGGGDPEDERSFIGPPNCEGRPEICR
jgi:hypothetical protein